MIIILGKKVEYRVVAIFFPNSLLLMKLREGGIELLADRFTNNFKCFKIIWCFTLLIRK